MRVLLIEDDEELANGIAVGLRRAHLAVDVALDGRTGLQRALLADYDVVVLDRDCRASTVTRCAPGSSRQAAGLAC